MTVLDNKLYSEQSPPLLGDEQEKLKIKLKDIESGNHVREKWGKEIEFLLSCIALSVGLGNVWRFPFIALENGGGAFVIPYIIVLLLIGRPVYYMEVVIGQFSSRGCIRAFDMVPIMRGIGYGQVYATALATTYYACIMGLTVKYLLSSFSSVLPWAYCLAEWGPNCINSTNTDPLVSNDFNETIIDDNSERGSSAEFYFTRIVLKEVDDLSNGLGVPSWDLLMCLAIAWIIIGLILWRGIKSSGKASYFLAIFPYFVLLILLIRAVTLPGSLNGIIYFLKPQWDQLLNPKVWYNAITQVFFSLAICFGTLIMYASFNNFRKLVYRDVLIITTIDSMTSILAGCVIFGILGNLAYELKTDDIRNVVKGGAGLAFISYPDAIAKFQWLPQVFAVLFFSMLLVLGIGSNIGMSSCVITVIKDRYVHLPHWLLAGGMSIMGFIFGIIYMTPGGQFILNLIDFFGCSFIGLFLAIFELIAVGWIYGVSRLCKDIEFMFGIKTGLYWRICWAIITPALMITVLIYLIFDYQPLQYKNIDYPPLAIGIAWVIYAIGILQLPIWAIYTIYQQPQNTLFEKIKSALKPTKHWGPLEKHNFEEYQKYRSNLENNLQNSNKLNIWHKILNNILN